MPSCVINCCKNNSSFQKKASGITFHKFPADKTWKENWIKTIRDNRNDNEWLPSKFSVVCSSHFEEADMYNTKGGYRRIKKNATPKKIHLVNFEWCQGMEASGSSINPKSSTLGLHTELCNIDEEVDVAGIVGDISDKEDVSNHQPEIRDSELESIFDTPKKNKLRQEARKYKLCYQIHTRKIKTLNQKIKRLKKKNASLQTVLKDIKNKNYIDTDVFNLLGENIVAAEICHNINKKNGGKKKIKYSSAMKNSPAHMCKSTMSYTKLRTQSQN